MGFPEASVNRNDRFLWVATGLGIGAVVFASASMCICTIAAACPPVSKWFDATGNARLAASARNVSLLAALLLGFACVTVVQVVVRRPFGMTRRSALAPAMATSRLVAAGAILLVLTAFVAQNIYFAITGILIHREGPLTDEMAFGGIGLSFAPLTVVWASMSTLFLTAWWRQQPGQVAHVDSVPSGAEA